jgi:hypothetical protein
MITKYYVTDGGVYLGGYQGSYPVGGIEVPTAPSNASSTWNGSEWVPKGDYGDLNYKALIRRQADDLGNASQYWEAIKLLKTIGE